METDVIVVGGGLAGLIAARTAQAAGARVVVFDPHPGGRGRSDLVGDRRMNRGPHALYLGGAAERVLMELGVPLDGTMPPVPGGRALFGDSLVPLPLDPASLAASRLMGLRAKAAYGMFMTRARSVEPRSLAGTSVADWTADLPDRARLLVQALVRLSTYTDLPEQQSADVVVTALRGATNIRYLSAGWQSMVDSLRLGLTIESATVTAVGEGGVTASDGEHRARAVVLAVGTPAAAFGLLGEAVPARVGPDVVASCLDLGLAEPARLRHRFALGIDEPLYASLHPGPVLHLARYGGGDRQQLDALGRRLGSSSAGVVAERYLHRMKVLGAMPVAEHGGMAGRVRVDEAGAQGVYLAGDWVGPEGNLLDAVAASAVAAGHRAAGAALSAR